MRIKKTGFKKTILLFALFLITAGLLFSMTGNFASADGTCGKTAWITSPIDCLLLDFIIPVIVLLIKGSVSIFIWMVDAQHLRSIIDNEGIYVAWKAVRDFLNIAFILVLLFSAFCTIFQISQFSYKNVLLKLILMALLVNFSFPITRFIIDVSNVLMYTILRDLLSMGPEGFFPYIADAGYLGDAAKIEGVLPSGSQLLLLAVFLFLFAVTILIMGLLFLIRTVALAILIIFSPVAFTGSIIPGFIGQKASGWWNELFKYAFFGPIMVFMLYISTVVMKAILSDDTDVLKAIVENNSFDKPSFVASLCMFLIPLVILWVGMGTAMQMGVAGAGAITGFAQNKLKGMGKWTGLAPYRFTKWGVKKGIETTGIPGGIKQIWDKQKKSGRLFGSDAIARREAGVAEKLGVEGAVNENLRKRANEELDNWKKKGAPDKDKLIELSTGKDKIKARAASMKLAQDGNIADLNHYDKIIKETFGNDESAIETFNDALKKKQRDLILAHDVKEGADLSEKLGNLNDSDFGSIDFTGLSEEIGREKIDKYFGNIDNYKRVNIAKHISGKSKAFLGNSIFAS